MCNVHVRQSQRVSERQREELWEILMGEPNNGDSRKWRGAPARCLWIYLSAAGGRRAMAAAPG